MEVDPPPLPGSRIQELGAYLEPRDAPEPITAPEPLTAEEWTRRHGHGWFLIRRDPEFEGEHVEYGESIRRFVLSRTTMTD